MAGLGDFAQRAFYLGIGLASLTADKAGEQLDYVRKQAQKLADELVERGEMNAEAAKAFVDDLVAKGQKSGSVNPGAMNSEEGAPGTGPRKITIDFEDEDPNGPSQALDLSEAARLRQQVAQLQAQLDQLKGQG